MHICALPERRGKKQLLLLTQHRLHAILSKPMILQLPVASRNHRVSDFLVSISESSYVFLNLKSLRLSKLADLEWEADIDDDKYVLEDWAGCLGHVSKILVELTFADCFACFSPDQVMVNVDGEESPWRTRVANSSRRFREIILPVLAGSDWPSLEILAFAGIHVGHRALRRVGFWTNLGSGVEVHIFPITTTGFCDDPPPV